MPANLALQMMADLQSNQERLCFELIERAGGRAHLFAPDVYDGNREPCDLAWVANDCVALFYMNENGRGLERANKHNLRQAKRWLRVWRDGRQRLVGRNGFRTFDIGPNDFPHVVVFSVVGCPGQAGAYHHEQVQALGVTAVATLTQDDLSALAHAGATLYDALVLVNAMRRGVPWEPHLCAEYTDAAERAVAGDLEKRWASVGTAVALAHNSILGMRGSVEALEASAIFADLALVDYLKIAYQIANALQWVWLPPNGRGVGYVRVELPLKHYAVLIQVGCSPEKLTENLTVTLSDPASATKLLLRSFIVSPRPDFATPSWGLTMPPQASQTRILLDQIQSEGATR